VTVASAASETLSVRNHVTVSSQDVLLQDLVHQPGALPQGWGTRTVLQAPAPGKTEDYPLTAVAYALQKYPDMKTVNLRGHVKLKIKREAVPVSADELRRAVEEYMADNEPWSQRRCDVEFAPVREHIMVAAGERRICVEDWTEQSDEGTVTFEVGVWVNDLPVQMVPVTVRIEYMQEVWVAAHNLERGHRLTLDDIETQWVPVGRRRRNYIPVEDSITGQEVIRSVRQGRPLFEYLVRPPVCAERGDRLNVHVRHGALLVSMRGKAMGKGRKGDRILCLNENSNRRLLVRLTGDRRAVVEN
jgi:flagella basal body P-ring formation protein FlgA